MLNSKLTQFDYYEDGTRGRILKPVFHENRVAESSLFKIPETVKTQILIYEDIKGKEDEFKFAYNKSGLQGLRFEQIHPAEY